MTLLEGLRVIEASAFVSAPLGGLLLAELGARVIRVDPIGGSIDGHRWPLSPGGASLYWAGLNRSKRSLALDLSRDAGRELLASIVTAPGDGAGLFLTNLPMVGPLEPEALRRRRADLITVHITGDRDGRSQVDYTVNASTGYPLVTGTGDNDGPVNSVLPAWDIATGTLAAAALVSAALRRRQTGQGAHIELALEDVALAALGYLGRLAATQLGGSPHPRDGNYLYGAFGRDFVTADGRRLMVVAVTSRQWRALITGVGVASEVLELEARLGFPLDSDSRRYAARAEIAALLQRALSAMSSTEAAEGLERAGACWSWYRTFEDVAREEVATGNPMLRPLAQGGIGTYYAPASPVRVNGSALHAGEAPALGQHSEEIVRDILGESDAEIRALQAEGVIP